MHFGTYINANSISYHIPTYLPLGTYRTSQTTNYKTTK